MLLQAIAIVLLLSAYQERVSGIEVTVDLNPRSGLYTNNTRISMTCHTPQNFEFGYFFSPVVGQIVETRPGFRLTFLGPTVTLEILNPTPDDEGTYDCIFYREGTMDLNGAAHGQVMIAYRESVVVTTGQPSYEGFVSEKLSITCQTMNAISVEWRSPSDRVIITNGRFTATAETLTIEPVQLEDAGNYSCVATNEVGLKRSTTQVIVTQRPSIEVSPSFIEVELGQRAVFTCSGEGYPPPSLRWLVVSTGAQVDQHQLVVDGNSLTSTLTFDSVSSSDIGSYKCEISNRGGTMSKNVVLTQVGTLAAIENVALTLINQTNILVTWDHPQATVLSYTVTWQASGNNGTQWEVLNGTNPPNSFIITDLERLTTYSVFVYGSNERGRGVDSLQVNITTDAIAPDNALSLVLVDLSPQSTGVTVGISSVDDGGAPLTELRLQLRASDEVQWTSHPVDISSLSVLLSGLQPSTTYFIRVQAANRIGFGPFSAVSEFTTSPVGYPGTPSDLSVSQPRPDSLYLCWNASVVGLPFTGYIVAGFVDGSPAGSWTISVDDLVEGNCYRLTGLDERTCYQFKISVSNNQGVGQRSPISQEACTQSASPPRPNTMTMIIVAAVVVGVLLAVGVVVLILLCLCCCVRLRQKHSSLPDRRGSSRSDATLMTYQTQTSSSSSSSDHSPHILAHNNSFDSQSDPQFFYQGSNTLNHPPSATGHHISPSRATHSLPGYYYNPQSASQPPSAAHDPGDTYMMIDNPYYKRFQLQKIPENEEHINYAYARVPLPLPPVEPPPLYSDTFSDVAPSDMSSIQMGESYSQPSSSPRIINKKIQNDDTDFVDNGAYQTIPQRGLQNGHSIYSDLSDSEPRFEIQSQGRGAIFETVQIRP